MLDTTDLARLPPPIVQAVEDAVLFGNIKEIALLLDMVCDDSFFPDDLRYGLESLMYFRLHYGRGGALEPVGEDDRLQAAQIESSWGRQLIESLGHAPDLGNARYA